MTYVRLQNMSVRLPIYDAGALRLFKRRTRRTSGVGSHDFIGSNGVLEVQALSDISLSLESGDRLALIGHNGAGKTTLLRVIAGIYPISEGTMEIEGKRCFYGSGMAINPDASGYENIRLSAMLSHLPQSHMDEYIRDIEEFTELGEYLDMPTRIYSAGMAARLSFALATMHTPDILLIDEGIGAGDSTFADKVEKRIQHFTQKARVVIAASHSADLLRKLCTKGAVFEAGHMVFMGSLEDALAYYENPPARGTRIAASA